MSRRTARDEQDDGEDVADPVEVLEQAEAAGDEGAAHDDGAERLPRRGRGAGGLGDAEEAEEQEEDEEVVDGERFFDGVAGEVLDGSGGLVEADEDSRRGRARRRSRGWWRRWPCGGCRGPRGAGRYSSAMRSEDGDVEVDPVGSA